MHKGYGKGTKRGGLVGNLVKIGGTRKKLTLAGDFRPENTQTGGFKKAAKQAHKRG
jgi:hypothetical protein